MLYTPIQNLDTSKIIDAEYLFLSFGIKGTSIFTDGSIFFDLTKQRFIKKQLNCGCESIYINRKLKAISKLKKYPISLVLVKGELVPF